MVGRIMELQGEERVGSRLRARRVELGLDIQDVSREAKIAPQYVRALEESDFEILSAKVYAQGFLKKVLTVVRVESPSEWVDDLGIEWNQAMAKRLDIPLIPADENRQKALLRRWLVWIFAAAALAGLLVVVGARIRAFTGRPALVIDQPQEGFLLGRPQVRVEGRTERESRLTVNGRELTLDSSGRFSDEIDLVPGLNQLEFRAESRFGKERIEIRNVVVK